MARYKPRRLKDEQDMLFVVSTHGEGDPPQPALGFFEFVESARAPRLESLRFAILALGDSTYEHYCGAGRRLDSRLEALGAERLRPRVDCDVDYDEEAASWTSAIVEALAEKGQEAPVAAAPAFPEATGGYDKRNPFPAILLENIRIVGRHSTKATRHLELSLEGSGLAYEPGDALGLVARNRPEVAEELIAALGLSTDAPVAIKGEQMPLARAFEEKLEIALATPRFLDLWAELSGSAELDALRGDENAAARSEFLGANHVVDIVRRFPVSGIDPERLVGGLRSLQPRLYSIASSLSACPGEVHLTLAPVSYELHGNARKGVASAHLEQALPGDSLPVYVQANPHFRLPADDVPIVMIGAGTGVAPYRGFMQEREARGATGRSWLFFGERNFRSDFLYQAEWQELLKGGTLSRLDVAFSRDAHRKAYVQHRLAERGAELWAWLQEGAHLYVCGDASAMAPDVHRTLLAIAGQQGGLSIEAAEEYLRSLVSSQRYQRDVY